MWVARFLVFLLAQAIASGLFDRFRIGEFLATRTLTRQQSSFLFSKDPAAASSSGSKEGSGSGSGGGLSSFFFGHPDAVVHSFDEESFLSSVVKGGDGAPWLVHLFSPLDQRAVALNSLLEEEIAPILYLSSAITEEEGTGPSAVKLRIGKIDVLAQPHLAASLGWMDEEEEEDGLAPHRSLLKIIRAPQQHHQHADHPSAQQPLLPPLSSSPHASVAALSRRLVVEDYHGRRTRQALLELAEHASTPASFFSSLYALPTPARLRTRDELAAFMAEHPFVFVLAEGQQRQQQEGSGSDGSISSLDEVLRLAFVSTCEARMWRHCAIVGHGVLDATDDGLPFVAKLEHTMDSSNTSDDAAPAAASLLFPLDPAAFARRPEALHAWLQAQNHALMSPMPLALEGPAFDRLLRSGGRLVVARVRGGADPKEARALVDRLYAVGQGQGQGQGQQGGGYQAAWLRAGKVRLGYVVEDGPRTQLPLGASGEGVSSSLAPVFVVDGPTRGVYNVDGATAEALEAVVRGIVEGRMAVPTFPLVRKGDPLGAYPHVAKLLTQVHALVLAVAAALAVAVALGLLVLLSPRRWWIQGEAAVEAEQQEEEKEQQQEQETVKEEVVAQQSQPSQPSQPQHRAHHLVSKFGSGEISASITGAGELLESEM